MSPNIFKLPVINVVPITFNDPVIIADPVYGNVAAADPVIWIWLPL